MKDDYRTAYFNLHKKARLGANEDGKKKELLKDPRLESLKKLAGVSLLPHSTLTELQIRLAKVQTVLHAGQGRPGRLGHLPALQLPARRRRAWVQAVWRSSTRSTSSLTPCWRTGRKTLLDNLDDPTAKKSIKLLPDAQKRAVDAFLKSEETPGEDQQRSRSGDADGVVRPDRHPGEARRPARRPERRRRSLHGRADSDPVRGVRRRRSPVARNQPRFVSSSTVAKLPEDRQ